MDLSNLSNNLPTAHPITDDTINSLNRQLTDEFKNAAKSVAALYRLANTKNTVERRKGYLDCLKDICDVLQDGDDLENWVLTKRHEFGDLNKDSQHDESPSPQEDQLEEEKIDDYQFTMSSPCAHHFRPGMTPLSVSHSKARRRPPRISRNKSSSEEDDEADDPEEEIVPPLKKTKL